MRRANKGVLPSVLGVDGYNPSIGAKPDPSAVSVSASAPNSTAPSVIPSAAPVAVQPAITTPVRSSTAPAAAASIASSSTETRESALQKVDAALATISRYRTGGDGGAALKMLLLYIQNIVQNPTEAKQVHSDNSFVVL